MFIVASRAKNKTDLRLQDSFSRQLQGRKNAFMKNIMSVINGWSVTSTQAVIEKRYPATAQVIAEIQHSKSAMLNKALWHTLEIYAELKAKYV